MGNGEKLFLIGIVLSIIILIAIGTLNFSFAKVQNVRFEIAECSVQGNSTYEKSGPCPDPNSKPDLSKGSESSIAEPSPTVSSASEKEKTQPAPKISSLEAADQAEASTTESATLDNGIGNTKIEDVSNANSARYNFDDLHISGPDQEAAKIPEQSAVISPVPKVVEQVDPFGSVTK